MGEMAMAQGRRATRPEQGHQAVFQIGIDNFESLEELFGEALRTAVARVVEERLAAAAPEGAVVWQSDPWRLGLCVDGLGPAAAQALAADLQAAVALKAVETDVGPIGVTLGIGCAIGRHDETDTLTEAALDALRQARQLGAGLFRMAEDAAQRRERRAILTRAARAAMGAIQDKSLTIAFQPVVRADNAVVPAFHECLVRIQTETGILVPAADFMPAIERLGLAPLIDRQVLAMAFTTLEQHPGARLSINIFPQTMQDSAWIRLFREAVERRPDLADRLIIEVTETSAMLDPVRTISFMDSIRETGAAFAIDDFGAGHTSFRTLRRFRFDMVKLDGGFVHNIESDLDDRFFVRILGEIAERFEMMAVAEAVRRPAQARILRDLGIDYFQGFHFGAPELRLVPAPSPRPLIAKVST